MNYIEFKDLNPGQIFNYAGHRWEKVENKRYNAMTLDLPKPRIFYFNKYKKIWNGYIYGIFNDLAIGDEFFFAGKKWRKLKKFQCLDKDGWHKTYNAVRLDDFTLGYFLFNCSIYYLPIF